MKRICFFTSTNFHFMLAVDFIHTRYNENNGFDPYVFQLNRAGEEINPDLDLSSLPFKYRAVSYNEFGPIRPYPEFISMLRFLLDSPPDTCVFFLEQSAFAVWLNFFMRGKTNIVLAPDGNKPYYKVTRKAYYSRTMETIRIYRFLAKQGFPLFRPYFQSLNYGRLKGINEIWLEHPQSYQGYCREKLVQYSFLRGYNAAHPLNRIFRFSASMLPFTENGIYYVNNILYEQYLYDIEMEVLVYIRSKFPNSPFVIKYHPATPVLQVERFGSIPGVQLMISSVPFELISASLQNCILISMWSNALMHENPRCNIYWLNKYLEKRGKMLRRIQLVNPTKHIQEIEELDQLHFPSDP